MILAIPLPPSPGQVIVGVLGVLAGALIASVSAFLARRSRNWLYHLGTAGGLLIVAGIVGQRTVADGARLVRGTLASPSRWSASTSTRWLRPGSS